VTLYKLVMVGAMSTKGYRYWMNAIT